MHPVEVKNIALKMRENGKTYKDIGNALNISLYAARNLCVYQVKLHKMKAGRKLKITKKHQLSIKRASASILQDGERLTSRKLISKCDLTVSRWTVQRYMKKKEFKYSNVSKKLLLNSRQKRNRVEIISQWIAENHPWEITVFSDEKRFSLDGPDNWYSYHSKSFPLSRRCRQCKGGGLMVWAMVTPGGTVYYQFINGKFKSKDYIKIISDYAVPHIKNDLGDKFYLQQDNSPVHTSMEANKFFKEEGIPLIRWPAYSPDINIVEDIWKMLSDYVYDNKQFENVRDLKEKIEEGFCHLNSVFENDLKSLYLSIRHRLTVVLNKRGGLFNK